MKWTPAEIEYLRRHYAQTPRAVLVEKLKRKWSAIKHKAHRLGLRREIDERKRVGKHIPWSDDEIAFLKANYSTAPKVELIEKLKRSWEAIQKKALLLGLSRPTVVQYSLMPLNLTLSENDKAYIAGLFDGEGTITASMQRKRTRVDVRLEISNTCFEVLEWIRKVTGIGEIRERKQIKNWKKCYKYRIWRQNEIYSFLKAIYPYLKIKKEAAKTMINLIELKTKPIPMWIKRDNKGKILTVKYEPPVEAALQLLEKLHELNKRGSSKT